MPEVLVRAEGLSRLFGTGPGGVTAIEEATFEIEAGQCIALVGPSGSGKSTLLHLIAALDRPTAGTIDWPGLGPRDGLRPGPVAFAFQGPSLLPPLTVAENVALPILLAGGDEGLAMRQASDMLERLDLAAVADKLPEEISGGQSQRAGIARALVGNPRLILADEPTGQQDGATGQRLMQVVRSSAEEAGAALLVATHDPAVAERLDHRWSMTDRRLETGVVLRSA